MCLKKKLRPLLVFVFLAACSVDKEPPTSVTAIETPISTETPQPTSTSIPSATPSPTPPVQISKDILYVEPLHDNVSEQRLDVFAPHEEGPWPVVVFIHGSGRTNVEIGQLIAEQGFVVYTINWPPLNASLAAQENGRGFREIYEVFSCAVRYARATTADYGGDPSKVILVGFSGGARFGSWFALSGDPLLAKWEEFSAARGGPPAQVSCLVDGYSPNVDAFVGIGGYYAYNENLKDTDVELYDLVSPFAQVGERPELSVRLLHGDKDQFPVSYSARLHDLLEAAGYDTELMIFDGGHVVPLDPTIKAIFELAGVE